MLVFSLGSTYSWVMRKHFHEEVFPSWPCQNLFLWLFPVSEQERKTPTGGSGQSYRITWPISNCCQWVQDNDIDHIKQASPRPLGHRLAPWAVRIPGCTAGGEWASMTLHLLLSSLVPHCSQDCLSHPPPCPWKNGFPQNWSLVPKRLGTADVRGMLRLAMVVAEF